MGNSAIVYTGNHISIVVAGEDQAMGIVAIQGQRLPIWSLTFKTADNAAYNLTGVTYTSAVLFDTQAVGAGTGQATTGTFATVTAASGTATFSPSAADVTVPGEYIMEALLTTTALPAYFRWPVTILPRFGA